jgi:hypothetical protein
MRRLLTTVLLSGLFILPLAGCGEGGGEMEILNIDPRNGPTRGDQPVKILGENFRTDIGYTVFFGNQRSPSVTIVDPQTMVATAPAYEEEGMVDITIRSDDGSAFRISEVFEYQELSGGVVDRLGEGPEKQEGGGLAY